MNSILTIQAVFYAAAVTRVNIKLNFATGMS